MLPNPVTENAVNEEAAHMLLVSPSVYRQTVLDCVLASKRIEGRYACMDCTESTFTEVLCSWEDLVQCFFVFFVLKSEQEGMSNSVYSHIWTWQLTVFTNEYFGLRSKGITMDCSVGCLALIPNRKAKSVCNNSFYPVSIRMKCVLRETAIAKSRVQMISMSLTVFRSHRPDSRSCTQSFEQ